jgi:pimeloyl-ACP methyl ester carboxylesterase
VVLLHQTPRSVDEFAEVLPRLAASRRAVAVDTPGYGCSDRPKIQPTIGDYAAALREALDELDLERVHLVGHHTGAVVAVELAAALPERVGTLVLSGPLYLDAAMRKALGPVFAQWRVRNDGSHLTEKWQKFSDWTDDPALVNRVLVDLLRAGETSEFGHFAAAEYRMEDRLPLVRSPTCLVYGKRDFFSSPESSGSFHEILGTCRTVVLDGGVFLPNEDPGGYARAVLENV